MVKFFALAPEIIFSARVNQSAFSFPISQVSYDNVTVGNYSLLEHGLMILFGTTPGGDDLGRQRIGPLDATADTIYFGRCSEGQSDGEVSPVDNCYLTAVNLFQVWSKTPYIDPATGVQYKDGSLTVGVSTTTPPPVANAGIPAAGTVDGVTGLLRVRLPSGAQTSFATCAGATITTYAWELPAGVTLVAGYALGDPVIEVDCEPGHHYIALAVVDSNGQTHQARTFVIADDPDATLFIPGVTVTSHRRTLEGQTLTVRLTQPLDPSTYPDGTLVALVDGEPANSADRTNILFWGWHQSDPAQIQAQRTGLVKYTEMTCVDVQGRLASLPGFPQVVENDLVRDTTAYPSITWAHMVGLTLDLYLHYLLYWHSTALELTDYFPTLTTTIYSIGGSIQSDGGSLWEQVKTRVKAFVPSKSVGCDLYGRLLVRADPLEEEPGVRTATVNAALTAANLSDIRFTHTRSPGVHWLRGNAIKAISPLPVGTDGEQYQPTFFCIAPGDVPGQGETEETFGEHLSPSQTLLNTATGHHYARINARESLFDLTLVGPDWQHLDPAAMQWVTLTLDAAYAAQRGLSFTAARGLLHEVNYGYPASATGTTRTCRATWERETVGRPALTVTQPDVDPVDDGNDDWYTPPTWVPPLPGDPSVWYGDPAAYILWDGAHVMRTWDILAASPVWELVDTGITGAIYDGQYVHVSATTVGMWLLTADGIWWCGDIMAAAPAWTLKLALTTVQAADEQIAGYPTVFAAMYAYASEPGYLIVVTQPSSPSEAETGNYLHAYSWHTHDYGATWTQVDMSEFTESGLGYTSGYAWCGRYGIAIYASAQIIWIVRTASYFAGGTAVFKSVDGGHTWTKEFYLTGYSGDIGEGASLLAPFPDIDGPSYMNRGNPLGAIFPFLYVSSDAWATGAAQTKIANYRGLAQELRVNSNTFEPDHVLAFWNRTADGKGVLFESDDAGATWTELWDSGATSTSVQTPNGWPPDTNVWFVVRPVNSSGVAAEVIRYTDDKFATAPVSKVGNLAALITDWVGAGYCGGFCLPKVPPNVP